MYFTSITVTVHSLKQLLQLFNSNQKIDNLELIDTAHPMTGCIDETILNDKYTIESLIQVDYDFRGLVQFTMQFNSVHIQLITDNTYEIYGQANDLKTVINKLIKEDLSSTSRYQYTFRTDYKSLS